MTAAAAPEPSPREIAAGARATYTVFAALGLAGATWASRLPQIRARMDLDPVTLGLLLLMIAVGGVVVLPLAGTVVTRFGPRRTVNAVAVLVGVSLGAVALGYALWTPLVGAGLFLLGTATGFWDVAVTVHAAAVERRIGRSVMPRFFAAFSLGTVAGACLGALMTAWRVPVGPHIGGVAVGIALATPVAARNFLPDSVSRTAGPTRIKAPRRPAPWRDPRTPAIGLVALAFAAAEGAGSNWISLTVIDRHHTTAAVGTLAYAAFLAAVTLGRWLGPLIVDRLGRPGALRAAAAAAAIGVALFALGPAPAGPAGLVLWGTGAALGFPVALSAGADDPDRAAHRVGVITSIGYCGFAGGPPLIGFLADETALAPALLVVAVLMLGAATLAGAARPAPPVPHSPARTAHAVTPTPSASPGEHHAQQPACDRDQ
ncbi:MFS transporter [Streptomyces spiralis]|uniref:MFS transporter n=1 Tax=Streptomyces spiralis TaxID=66376 RepID=A0A919AQX6_9ACTN|nr:MFS transporter [Streptomyces spiralis]GHF19109.1 MFS transporter [Streptomyces spiralis]